MSVSRTTSHENDEESENIVNESSLNSRNRNNNDDTYHLVSTKTTTFRLCKTIDLKTCISIPTASNSTNYIYRHEYMFLYYTIDFHYFINIIVSYKNYNYHII